VVIPTRDRPVSLRATIEAVVRLDPPDGGFEAVVVDDGGTSDLGFLEGYQAVRVVRQAGAGPAAARNAGAAVARGAGLAFTDDDCRPAGDWLVRLADQVARHPRVLVGGRTVNALDSNPFSTASQALNTFLYTWQSEGTQGPTFLASNNLALSRCGFEAVGGFDPSFQLAAGEDRAFCNALRRAGYRLIYLPQARVMHHHHLSALGFWQQHVRYGRGAFQLRQREAESRGKTSPPVLHRRIAFTVDLLAQPFRNRDAGGRSRALLQFALLAGSQAATASGYALAWMESLGAWRKPGQS
jgi:GT2 family glycosyltransferase